MAEAETVPPADPPITEFRTPTEAEWRANPDRVRWWREVLDHPFGRELAAIVREAAPEVTTGDLVTSPERALVIARLHREAEGSMLGLIAGYNRLRNLLFKTLATQSQQRQRPPRPGEQVEPHTVTIIP